MHDFDTLKAQKDAIAADNLMRCTICGFIVDTSYAAEKPTCDFTTRGRAKGHPNRLREALEWYAAAANWNRDADVGRFWRQSPAMEDGGKRARDALGIE